MATQKISAPLPKYGVTDSAGTKIVVAVQQSTTRSIKLSAADEVSPAVISAGHVGELLHLLNLLNSGIVP